ncbi:right-handed parallel beta-helix repeat-containing protein [Halobacillus sp. MO56]
MMGKYTDILKRNKPDRTSADDLGEALLTARLRERLRAVEQKTGEDSRHYIAVNMPGIKGNGKHDDTSGIQSLLDEAKRRPNGISLYFPAGVYKLTSTLVIYEGTRIECHPKAIFNKVHHRGMLKNIEKNSTDTGYEGNGNITIIGGIWDNNGHRYLGGTSFVIGHAKNLIFRDLTIKDVSPGHGMEINSSMNVLIDGCKFIGMAPKKRKLYSEAIQLDLMKSSGVFPWKKSHFDHTPCQDVMITNCYFGPSDRLGSWGRAIGSHSATADRWHKRIIISNNIVSGTLQWGIRAYSWEDITITGNILDGCGAGLSIDPNYYGDNEVDSEDIFGDQTNDSNQVKRVTIQGNHFIQPGAHGSVMSITGDKRHDMLEVSVTGNTIEGAVSTNAIYLAHVAQSSLSENIIVGAEKGIKLTATTMVNVTGNIIKSISSTGVEAFTGNRDLTIANNALSHIGGHGIWITCNDTTTISNNRLTGIGADYASESQGIRVTSSCNRISLVGNIFSNREPGFQMACAIYTAVCTTNALAVGNNAAGIGLELCDSISANGNIE